MSGDRINMAIPSLINGVSQQPSATRLASQGEEQINGYSSVVDGLRKRPPLRHVAKILDGDIADAFVHAINRDASERYAIVVTDGDVRAFDMLDGGREIAVAFPDGKNYLSSASPRDDFALVTVADHSFVVNKSVATAMKPLRTPPAVNEAIVYVKRGYVSTTYKVMVGGSWISYRTPDPYNKTDPTTTTSSGSTEGKQDNATGESESTTTQHTTTTGGSVTSIGTQPSTEDIAGQLAAGVRSIGGFTAEVVGSSVRIRRTNGADFAFRVTDSWGEEALVGIKREVMKFTDLPAKCWDGTLVRVTGESVGRDDDYYVVYNSEGNTKNGIWEETRGWNQSYALDPATMPHLLVREADGTFTFKAADWNEAGVGDDVSVSDPSFVGSRIADVFFYRDRLGFIAGENVVLSQHNDYFNFWPKTATTVLATDPIDVAVSHVKVSLLRHAVPFGESLLLFSDQTQFQLGDGGAASLSPETVKIDQTTEFECSRHCKPVGAGQNVYFVIERGDNSAVREYFVAPDNIGNDADDITSHISRYIPRGIHKMIASSNEDVIALLSSERANEVYVYKYFWVGTEKAQSSWSRWVFPEGERILSVANIEAEIFFVIQRPDGVYLDRMELQSIVPDDDLAFQVHLDRRIIITGVYDAAARRTVWQLPYPDTRPLTVVLGGAFKGRGGKVLSGVSQDGSTLTVAGDYSGGPCVIGRQYAFHYTFSEQHRRESREVAAPIIQQGRLQLRNCTLLHHDSGYFRTVVTSKGREPAVAEHLGTLGDLAFRVGVPVIDSNPHRFGVLARSSQVKIEIINDRHFPSNFQSAELTATFNADAVRI